MCDENRVPEKMNSVNIEIETLESICRKHLPKGETISFLKIDVEGMEKDVLLGADFDSFRPEIVVVESTKPMTDIPTWSEWECLLTDKNYEFGYMKGVNRFYFAKEAFDKYKDKVLELDNLDKYYFVEKFSRSF